MRDQAKLRGVDVELVAHPDRALDRGLRLRIAAGRSIEDEDFALVGTATFDRDEQKIMDRVDADTRGIAASKRARSYGVLRLLNAHGQLGVWSLQDSFGRYVSIGHAIEDEDGLVGRGEINFVMHRVDADFAYGAHTFDLRFVSLDDAKRRFLAASRSAER